MICGELPMSRAERCLRPTRYLRVPGFDSGQGAANATEADLGGPRLPRYSLRSNYFALLCSAICSTCILSAKACEADRGVLGAMVPGTQLSGFDTTTHDPTGCVSTLPSSGQHPLTSAFSSYPLLEKCRANEPEKRIMTHERSSRVTRESGDNASADLAMKAQPDLNAS